MPVVASKLVEIHNAAKKLIRAETRGDRSNVTVLRETLNRLYDGFVDLYGPSRDEVPRRPELIAADRYHPSDAGYARWAELMWAGVEARLRP